MSKVTLHGYNSSSHCGYCDSNNSKSFGLTSKLMRSSDYEALMLKGWRRCGNYYYKPDVFNSCCKLNTIRCNAGTFTPNRSQRKVLNKFSNFTQGIKPNSDSKKSKKSSKKKEIPNALKDLVTQAVKASIKDLIEYREEYTKITKNIPSRIGQFGHYSISSWIAISSSNKDLDTEPVYQKLLSELNNALDNTQWKVLNTANKFINLIDSNPSIVEETKDMNIDLKKYNYTTEIVSADYSEESFLLYKAYQISVHKDSPHKIRKDGYENFLCGNNLVKEKASELYPLGLGNFHMLHRLDGKLIAVGVLDFLPTGISSVYYFYSPDYANLSLGVLGALKEIELVKSNMTEAFQYYYLGFYIHSCQKMKYKGEYLPSELLCPTNYVWVDITKCLINTDHGFTTLSLCTEHTANQKDFDMDWETEDFIEFTKQYLQIELNGKIIKLNGLNERGQNYVLSIIIEAKDYIGKNMMKRLVFKFN